MVKGYMQVPGVDYTESFSPVATDTTTRIMIGLSLFQEEEGWVDELGGMESVFIHPDIPVDMFIEWPGDIVDLGITAKEFLEQYCILLVN